VTVGILQRIVDTARPAAQPLRPAVIRLGVGAYAIRSGLRRRNMFKKVHRQHPKRFKPVGLVRVLKEPLPPKVADALFDAAQVANLASTLGIAHRITGPLNAALQLWTLSYRNSWGMILHNDNTTVLHQIVLGTTRSADALSVDALVRDGTLTPDRFDRHYGGVPTLVNLATTAVYLISGVAKVRSPMGWKWAMGRTLREQIAADAVRKELFGSEAAKLAGPLYRAGDRFGVLAAGALLVELGAPLAMADRRLGKWFSLAAVGMHWGIYVAMNIKFRYNMSGVAYLGYFPAGPQQPPAR
jgi:hypothetical protein